MGVLSIYYRFTLRRGRPLSRNDVKIICLTSVSKNEMLNGSLKWGLPGHKAHQIILWGQPVILVLSKNGDHQEIHDIQFQEVENGKIVSHKS
jgi:hypothetical protein